MKIVLEFQTTNFPTQVRSSALFINLYRTRNGITTRIFQTAAGRQYLQLLDALMGDQYTYVWFDSDRVVEGPPSKALVIQSGSLYAVAVTGYMVSPSGDVGPLRAEVVATLFASGVRPTTEDGGHIVETSVTETDSTGRWVLYLLPNDLIRPVTSYWKIAILGKTYFKKIDSSKGQSQNFASLEDVTPFETS